MGDDADKTCQNCGDMVERRFKTSHSGGGIWVCEPCKAAYGSPFSDTYQKRRADDYEPAPVNGFDEDVPWLSSE